MSDATKQAERVSDTTLTIGKCGDDCPGMLFADISADGSAWERDRCTVCKRTWFHDPPNRPAAAHKAAAMWAAKSAPKPSTAAAERVSDDDLREVARLVGALVTEARGHAESAAHGGVAYEHHARTESALLATARLLPRLAAEVVALRAEVEALKVAGRAMSKAYHTGVSVDLDACNVAVAALDALCVPPVNP